MCSQIRNVSHLSDNCHESRLADFALRQQCEYCIEIYKVLIFPLVALQLRSTHRSLYERTDIYFNESVTLHAQRSVTHAV